MSLRYEIIKDPVYGYTKIFEHELKIVNTHAFQRLRRVRQLPAAHYVYPGATHTRFSHSLGVMHISGMFVENLLQPLFDAEKLDDEEFDYYFHLMRLWGLTHDLGHGPFSHTFDSVIFKEYSLTHELMSAKIVKEDKTISKIIRGLDYLGIDLDRLLECLAESREEWTSKKKIGTTRHSENAFYQILKGFYSTDIIDYLLRDNHYTGAGYGNFDWQRLIINSQLYKNEVALDIKAREALDAFLLSRLFMFETVYYHRTSRAVERVIQVFLEKAKEKIDFEKFISKVDKFIGLDDESIFHISELKDIPEREMLIARKIPYSRVAEKRVHLSNSLASIDGASIESSISEIVGSTIPKDAYFVDTPNLRMNPMIGENQVCILDNSVNPPSMCHESISKTSFGEIPYAVWSVRLYLHKRYKVEQEKLRKAFNSILDSGMTTATHF